VEQKSPRVTYGKIQIYCRDYQILNVSNFSNQYIFDCADNRKQSLKNKELSKIKRRKMRFLLSIILVVLVLNEISAKVKVMGQI
jgi:hypothetical protein